MYLVTCISLLAAVYQATAQMAAAQTLYSDKSFNTLRTCAIGCFESMYGTWGCCDEILSPQLGCPLPYPNSCFCRADLQPVASSIVSKCVSSACGNIIDVNSAVGVYIGYCATATQPMPTAFASSTAAASSAALTSITSKATSKLTSAEVTVIRDFAGSSFTLAVATGVQSSAFTVGTSAPSMTLSILDELYHGIIHRIILTSS